MSVGVTEPFDPTPQTSLTLLSRAATGCEDSWRRLASIYAPLVYRWIRACGLSPHDSLDVSQEVFIAVCRNLQSYDAQRGRFRSWLWQITRNKVRDHWRNTRSRSLASDRIDDTTVSYTVPIDVSDETESVTVPHLLIRQAIRSLQDSVNPNTWQAAWLTIVEGRPANDVAEELGMSVGAVYVAKSRVLARLREELGDLESDLMS